MHTKFDSYIFIIYMCWIEELHFAYKKFYETKFMYCNFLSLNTKYKVILFSFYRDLSVENLSYLSSEQALADLAYFITYIRDKYKLIPNKLITLGGSYPGIYNRLE